MTCMTLETKQALVSGGSSGIGMAICKALSAAGARVANADIAPPAVGLPAGITHHRTDIRIGAEVDRLFDRLHSAQALPDILVLNAGIGLYEPLCEGDPEKWQRLVDTNFLGALRLIRAFVPPMLENQGGDVVFIGSVSARQPHPSGGVYSASKSALADIAETLRMEAQSALRVCTVSPGVVDTSFFDNLLAGEQSVEEIGYGSLDPAHIAELVVFALTRAPEVAINHITVRPRKQVF
ncbi:hypothetical protein CAI21_19320 [Alkalilimnicola ehrlichii]|uniref:Short-chain dehydrogenase n=1 Tax=Alkalilimnicola ehrlichii TaxID=351052 RepID=A0A3E0WJC3_9GAMM|nr:SDR family oxidoreductase [Alkalilimnicola ehrlichii]RFA25384.1 hypothetical protein CAI21_19320 [Alkalilimnicola ehrlichii]RFA32559.1 hypothetical protein CAL65_19585 [Alkalilimnicola ehrlichii]